MTTELTDIDRLDAARREFRDQLVGAGLLYPMGSDGMYGRGAGYERIVAGLRRAAVGLGREMYGTDPMSFQFPPLYSRDSYEKTDYIASFPDLAGVIFTFTGGDKEHRALLADRAEGIAWDSHLTPSDTVLVPAACHPTYPLFEGTAVPDEGVVYTLESWCFRHEPSVDPLRQQAFRMTEFVIIGTPEQASAHRDAWIKAAHGLFVDLGLDISDVPANDPFFGRAGRILAVNQRDEELKYELVVPIYGDLAGPTAIASGNYHLDHFGGPYDITAGGAVAHSACFGFGLDRIALALLRTYGVDVDAWPTQVWERLGDSGGAAA